MKSISLYYLDTDSLIHLATQRRSHLARCIHAAGARFVTTARCFTKALGALEGISEASEALCELQEGEIIQVENASIAVDEEAERLARKYGNPYGAHLLATLRYGEFARLNAGRPALVTEDAEILEVAAKERLRAVRIQDICRKT